MADANPTPALQWVGVGALDSGRTAAPNRRDMGGGSVSENEGRSPESTPEGEPPSEPEPPAAPEGETTPAAEAAATEPSPEPAPAAETAAVTAAAAATAPPPPPATTSEWTPPPAAAMSTPVPLSRLSDYPLNVDVPADPGQNRLWGIPFVGLIIRAIL